MPVSRTSRADLLDPRELDALGGLELIARAVVSGFIAGLHSSPSRGFSVEFAEHRAYRPGDDLRFVDWKMYGRSDRFFLKQYVQETNMSGWICLDVSRSMDWRSQEQGLLTKLDYAKRLTASLALLLVRQGDLAGLISFADDVVGRIPPRGTLAAWTELVTHLAAHPAGGRSDAQAALDEVAGRGRRRGLVVLISDLLVDEVRTRRALSRLRHQGHEVLVLHLLDPGELELPGVGEAVFVDPESGDEVPASSSDLRTEYREAVRSVIEEWQRYCGRQGIDYHSIVSDRPLAQALGRYLHTRMRLR